MKKFGIFCSFGLGDGLIFLVLAKNIIRNGYSCLVYHDSLKELKSWLDINVEKYPEKEELEKLAKFDFLIINEDHTKKNRMVREYAKKNLPEKTFILKPSTAKKPGKNSKYFDTKKSVVDNLLAFCENELLLQNVSKENGLTCKKKLVYRKYKRIVIHPTAKNDTHRWPKIEKEKIENKKVFIIPDEKTASSVCKN